MSSSYKKHIITINSLDNQSSDNNNAVFRFENNDLHQVFRIQLKDVSIVNLLNNIETGKNDVLDYDFNGVAKSITIPQGNYTASTLINQLNALQTDIVFTFSNFNYKISGTSTVNTFLKNSSTIKNVIGLTTTTAPNTSYTLQNPVDLIRTNFIHIVSNLASLDSLYSSKKKNYPIIASIPLLYPYGFVNNFSESLDSADEDIKKSNVNISDVDISFLDDKMEPLDLNGGKYFISFTIWKR